MTATLNVNENGEAVCIHCGKVVDDTGIEWLDEDENCCAGAGVGFHDPWRVTLTADDLFGPETEDEMNEEHPIMHLLNAPPKDPILEMLKMFGFDVEKHTVVEYTDGEQTVLPSLREAAEEQEKLNAEADAILREMGIQ